MNNNIINTKINPKCTKCHCHFVSEIKSSGLSYKTCNRCRGDSKNKNNQNKCEHNKRRSVCKLCGGSQICEHDKIRSTCKFCGGGSICEHDKRRSRCKLCCGGSICEHNKQRSQCKLCGGGSICEHNKHRNKCKLCGGSQICEHDRIRSTCKLCGGSQICEHDKIRSTCKLCGGGSICEHDKQKSSCKLCNFKLYLVHLQRKQIKRCFNNSNLNKNKHSIEYLGCTIEELIDMFNAKMLYFNDYLASGDTMTWDNIHVDHIKPVSVFNLDNEDEFLDCCHYSNLQPLLTKDNFEKHNKWTEENEKYWLEHIQGKDYNEIYLT